jgi:hypothetical protein
MARLRVVGVRHHSPACARLVRAVIAAERPVAVLIEGPSDMTPRLAELALPHQLPVAIYSYCLPAHDGDPDAVAGSGVVAQAGWSPFCAYSPEWVALHDGAAIGARVAFIDLPGWHPAFATMANRYGDRDHQVSAALRDAAHRHGFDSTDALWDHLFEQPGDDTTLGARLGAYFAALRGDQEASDADRAREDFMADGVAWALAEADASGGGTVVVVCGGFHQAALERLVAARAAPPAPPHVEPPAAAIARTGSYLVPFSFFRLDSFTGYASGMPSPAFYQALWDDPAGAPETMAMAAVTRLRARGQRVSTADAIAAVELSHGLARLRGHAAPTRCDVLDGLAAALIKDALRAPVPWSARTVLARGTDPYLVEIVAAFSGDRDGALAPGTPQPPLVGDLAAELAAVGLAFSRAATPIRVDIFAPDAAARRRVLYRLRWLGVPGVQRVQRADLRRGRTQPVEVWQLVEDDRTAGAIIECAVWGATLAAAALARVYRHLQELTGVAELAAAMEDALHAGYGAVVDQLRERAADAIAREPQFAAAGAALARLAALHVADPARGLAGLLGQVLDRALWLLEGLTGPTAALDAAVVDGVVAIRAALEFELPDHALVAERVDAALHRRVEAADAPPAVRGAALGALWSRADADGAVAVAARADALVPALPLAVLGDFLGGVIALARHEFATSPILDAVDARLREAGEGEFLIALPQLRRAFAQFTPQERRGIARALVGDADEGAVLAATAEPAAVAAGVAFEAALVAIAARVGAVEAAP